MTSAPCTVPALACEVLYWTFWPLTVTLSARLDFSYSFRPTITDPIGHPNPLLKQTLTESQCSTSFDAGTLRATAVLNNLA